MTATTLTAKVRSLAFDVYGDPVPQGSMRAFVIPKRAERKGEMVRGKAVIVGDSAAKLKTWRSDVVVAAREALHDEGPLTGPVTVFIVFHLRQPKRPKAGLPIVRPDVDKLARSCLDALAAAGVFADDAQVTDLTVKKRYADEPRAYIAVSGEKLDVVERVR